jgi:hypothetical protein
MRIFLELIDSNAQIAAFKKSLGLSKDQVLGHMKYVTFYREIVALTEQIKPLLKKKKGNEKTIGRLRNELKSVIKRWRNV